MVLAWEDGGAVSGEAENWEGKVASGESLSRGGVLASSLLASLRISSLMRRW